MEQIRFDSGMKKYRINGNGVLEFNPCDPNVFARFLEATEKIRSIETELTQQASAIQPESAGEETLRLMAEADSKMKALLGEIFGGHNDFNAILLNLLGIFGDTLVARLDGLRAIGIGCDNLEALGPSLLATID